MEALADKVHKQGEYIFHNKATFHTTIPTSSSDTPLGGTISIIFTATYVGMVV